MKIDWDKIKDNYLKAYGEAIDFFPTIRVKGIYKLDIQNICYCDIEKFFDDNGIIISINHDFHHPEKPYFFVEIHLKEKCYYPDIQNFKIRDEAKEHAIPKAFEILNEDIK